MDEKTSQLSSCSLPNILIIISDQLTPQLTEIYGDPISKTPNLKRLSKEGVKFVNAYTNSPISAPARASMMTGRYVSNVGCYDNGVNFPADIPTFAHMLKLYGYEVIAAGKMHFVGPDQLHGIEKRLNQDIYPAGFKWIHNWEKERKIGIRNEKGFLVKMEEAGLRKWSDQMNYDEETHFRALEYIRRRYYRNAKEMKDVEHQIKPFCLIVSYTQPHSPYLTSKKYWDLYDKDKIKLPTILTGYEKSEITMDKWLKQYEGIAKKDLENNELLKNLRHAYYGMISYIDDKVGELMECLEKFDLRKNTAIIFTADHGDMVGERGFIEKRLFYEYSSRVPFICSFPKKWKSNAEINDPISLIDIFPTIKELIGADYPFKLDGRSLNNYLMNKNVKNDNKQEKENRIILSEYLCEGVLSPCFMVRKGKFKYNYVYNYDSQLFNLEEDPNELHNLSGSPENSNIEEELKQIILETFDCKEIERNIIEKQQRCIYIHKAMTKDNIIKWDFNPEKNFDLKYEQ